MLENNSMKFFKILLFLLLFTLFPINVYATTLSLQPSSGNITSGCPFYVDVIIDTQGQQIDASQVYLSHNLNGANENFSFYGSGLFSSYKKVSSLPSRLDSGLLGYGGGSFNGSNLKFGEIKLKSDQAGKAVNVDIDFDKNKSITSKVANQGNNILSSVSNGNYQVSSGYCETKPPNVQNLDPANQEPNHPVDGNIKFDLTDNSSGVDISTLQVKITHNNKTKSYSYNDSQVSYSKLNNTDYSVEIDPNNDFQSEVRVDVDVQVKDKAGNLGQRKYYFNDLTCKELGCSGTKITTQCNDGKDNDGDGLIDLNDPGCTDKNDNNEYQPGQTQCNDGKDNDGDGLIDFNDPQCQSESAPTQSQPKTVTNTVTNTVTVTKTVTGTQKVVTRTVQQIVTTTATSTPTVKPQCNDGQDNDGDGLVDYPDDPGCDSKQDNNEFNQATQKALSLSELEFYIDGVNVQPSSGNAIEVLQGVNLNVRLNINNINKQINSVTMRSGNKEIDMYYDNSLGKYKGEMNINRPLGDYDSSIRVKYKNGELDSIPFNILIQSSGEVLGRSDGGEMSGLANANIEIRRLEDGNYSTFKEVQADQNGNYATFVPNGTYKLSISKEGYNNDVTAGFNVRDNIINKDIQLLKDVNLLDPNVSTEEKAQYVQDLSAKSVKDVREIADDPQVEEQTERNIAPAAAAVTGAAVGPALGLLNLLNYLRFLFFQPLLLLGRRKREDWGVVYNSLTRKKLDLAMVRLVDYETNEVVQSRVTDSEGRYIFFAKPGTYRIKVEKEEFDFPTSVLADEEEDGSYTDIYHGEPIEVEKEDTAVAPNIPLDPVEAEEKNPSRLKWGRIKEALQRNLARIGIIAGIISMIVSPTILVGVLLAAQIGFYYLFKRLGTTPEPENWGIVKEKNTKNPVKDATVRLFTKERNNLVSTQRTDENGKYAFLAGPKDYYVRIDKEGYNSESREVSLKKDEEFVKEDIEIDKVEDYDQENREGEDDLSFAE